ncbi:MAG: carboxypeptidase-like regulatory domain-containing protein, partial [Bacteroidales bacterium]|nr:carboxypeptidase-like regulatory domain-containing protein [Bacteroidales bacterium]
KLIGANIYDSLSLKGTVTNNYGFYSLSLPKGQVFLVYSFVGYNSLVIPLDLKKIPPFTLLFNRLLNLMKW